MLAACIPFFGGFSLTRIFYTRDLTMFFWPAHLWIRRSLIAGVLPLWDPYAAAGQATFPNALNQLFLPPVMLLRALLPAVPGFNLIVAAPFPLAALGAWLFLRRHVSGTGATLGAIVFAAGGPVVSTANFPNLSWSVAWIPWILWAADRDRLALSARSFSLVTALLALQMLSGEPVTMIGTMALLVAYVGTCAGAEASIHARALMVARVGGALLVAVLLSAVQLVPMALAARASPRGVMPPDNLWSIHPLWLVESVLPRVFGNTFQEYLTQLPWISPLNSGRDPFFYSLYVGPIVLMLSGLGMLSGPRRWRFFWLTVVAVGLLLAFGSYTPVYPALQRIVPVVQSFRYPAKFLLFVSLGVAMLVANAVDALQEQGSGREDAARRASVVRMMIGGGLAAALLLVAAISLVLVAPFTGARAFYRLGEAVGVSDPVAGAMFLFGTLPPIATRVLILLLTSLFLAYLGRMATREGRLARTILFGLATAELLLVNAGLSPVLAASRLGPPAWTAAMHAHPADRFYFGGKFRGTIWQSDVDLREIQWRVPPGVTVEEGRTAMVANLSITPAAWGVRELISYDLPQLWPVEQAGAVALFEHAGQADRLRFLARGGVRYCLLAKPPRPGVPPIQLVGEEFGTMAVYECVPDARRTYVVPQASVVPDVGTQLARLFDPSFEAESTVMLEQSPHDPAGLAGTPVPASASITLDAGHEVAIEAAAGIEGGYLVLLDSFDRSWRADVDGQRAPLVRANALYRAVRLAPGRHVVRFVYRPIALYACAAISGLTSFALAVLWIAYPRPNAAEGPSARTKSMVTGRYLVVGLACALLHNAIVISGDWAGIHYAVSYLLSFAVVVSLGYWLHSGWTFPDTARGRMTFARYVVMASANYPVYLAGMFVLVDVLSISVPMAAPIVTVLLAAWNFFANRWALRAVWPPGERA